MRLVFMLTLSLIPLGGFVRAGKAESPEIADRTPLESVWKRSGRTTRVIDYPFSPQPWTSSGPDLRDWGNQGYIFINPRIGERLPAAPTPAPGEEPSPVEAVEVEELSRMLDEEKARRAELEENLKQARTDLTATKEKTDDQALKIMLLEKQIEDMGKPGPTGWTAATGAAAFVAGTEAGPATLEKLDQYPVKPDQSLWGIAGKPEVYGNPFKWLLLYHANRDQIFDPDLIYPGMILLVPRYKDMDYFPPAPPPEKAVSAAGGEAAAEEAPATAPSPAAKVPAAEPAATPPASKTPPPETFAPAPSPLP